MKLHMFEWNVIAKTAPILVRLAYFLLSECSQDIVFSFPSDPVLRIALET